MVQHSLCTKIVLSVVLVLYLATSPYEGIA
jgi:hypothetical protein